jgi:site-specific DNA-methyltransferase (adenine-specific)
VTYEIINGDCLTVLRGMQDESVDITITSPPYNTLPIKAKPSGMWAESNLKSFGGYDKHTDAMPEPEYQQWINDVVTECLRVSKGLVWINHKTRYRKKKGIHPLQFIKHPYYCEVVWQRAGSQAFNCRKYASSHEFIYGFGEPHYWDRCNDTLLTVWKIQQVMRDKRHPCPYPLEIPKRLIESSCPRGGIVLYPFAGIATTGVAAARTGRDFIGIELSPEYCEIGRQRIEADLCSVFA